MRLDAVTSSISQPAIILDRLPKGCLEMCFHQADKDLIFVSSPLVLRLFLELTSAYRDHLAQD
jgi:hypothetical protein